VSARAAIDPPKRVQERSRWGKVGVRRDSEREIPRDRSFRVDRRRTSPPRSPVRGGRDLTRAPPVGRHARQFASTFAATMRGWNENRSGLSTSTTARTQWVLREPNVSTRRKFATTPPWG